VYIVYFILEIIIEELLWDSRNNHGGITFTLGNNFYVGNLPSDFYYLEIIFFLGIDFTHHTIVLEIPKSQNLYFIIYFGIFLLFCFPKFPIELDLHLIFILFSDVCMNLFHSIQFIILIIFTRQDFSYWFSPHRDIHFVGPRLSLNQKSNLLVSDTTARVNRSTRGC